MKHLKYFVIGLVKSLYFLVALILLLPLLPIFLLLYAIYDYGKEP